MKIKKIDGIIKRKHKLLSPAFGYVATKALIGTKEVLAVTKKNNGKCHNLEYVMTSQSSL